MDVCIQDIEVCRGTDDTDRVTSAWIELLRYGYCDRMQLESRMQEPMHYFFILLLLFPTV